MDKPKMLYRYVVKEVEKRDGLLCYNQKEVNLEEYLILTYTEKGYWVDLGWRKRWINRESKKKFAYPDKKDAWVNFVRRTRKHISILKNLLQNAEENLELIKNYNEKYNK